MSLEKELIRFCRSPNLVDLIELSKSSTDIMELLTPNENQHSDLLAWCFNAREGHGQGDALFKDFLLSVYHHATDQDSGDRIFGRGLTRDFVRAWTPARILTSSFATALCLREFKLSDAKAKRDAMRLDLLIIDPENQFLVVIENKAGARFRPGQLSDYIEAVQRLLLAKPAFKDYHVAFVAIDRNSDAEEDPLADENFDARWVRLDYSWLKPGSQRAEMSVHRGNQGAALLMSYCRAQTGHESESARRLSRKARDLAIEFPYVVEQIRRIKAELIDPKAWTPGLLRPDSEEGQLLRLYMQNKDALDQILDLSPLLLLDGKIEEHFPQYAHLDNWEGARVWMAYRLPCDREIPMRDDQWPLYLRIRHLNYGSGANPQFKLMLMWYPNLVPVDDVERVCQAISTVFPDAKGSIGRKVGMCLEEIRTEGIDATEPHCQRVIAAVQRAFSEFQ